jgi:hypothetical protein
MLDDADSGAEVEAMDERRRHTNYRYWRSYADV